MFIIFLRLTPSTIKVDEKLLKTFWVKLIIFIREKVSRNVDFYEKWKTELAGSSLTVKRSQLLKIVIAVRIWDISMNMGDNDLEKRLMQPRETFKCIQRTKQSSRKSGIITRTNKLINVFELCCENNLSQLTNSFNINLNYQNPLLKYLHLKMFPSPHVDSTWKENICSCSFEDFEVNCLT